jgi:linoleoyl-CoA desaturase
LKKQSAIGNDAFKKTLFERLNHFFEENNISKKANGEMIFKIILSLVWWIGGYLLLYATKWTYPQFFLLYLFAGLGQIYMILNITHDANHNAISKKKWINVVLSYWQDCTGVSSYMWRVMHNKGHHSVMNVYGDDEGIFAHGIFRFSPAAPWKPFHRFQHIYVFFLYTITSLDFLFVKDLEYLFLKNNPHIKDVRIPVSEYFIIVFSKLFYLFYMIALPVMILSFSVWQVILVFIITQFIEGLIAAWIIQLAHLLDQNEFPNTRKDYDFLDHIFATTTDYATRSRIANFVCGGLNHHVIHHIFPHVAHTHYPKLTKIVRETATEFNIDYRENRYMYQAAWHHIRLLYELSKPPVERKVSYSY